LGWKANFVTFKTVTENPGMANKMINILHVEDDEVDAMVMQRALKKTDLNYKLYHARNGLEALDMLRGTNGYEKISPRPAVILLDLNMPQMNGSEFLKELRSDEELRPISVYVMTTSSDDRDRLDAYDYNVAGYIVKPLSLESYVEAVSVLNNFWKLSEFP
jgi:CheY-like chemotaxis protein